MTTATPIATRVRELETEAEWLGVWPVLEPFWPVTDKSEFLDYRERLLDSGYRLFALVEEETGDDPDPDPVAVAGVTVDVSVWHDEHVRAHDLVVDPERRSEGFGEELLADIEEWGREQGYDTLVLNSALDRENAHSFYEDYGMDRDGYRFTKPL